MLRELVVAVVVEAFDCRVFDRAVPLPGNGLPANRERDAFDLSSRSRVLWFGCAVLDAERCAGIFKGVRPDGFALRQGLRQ